MASDSQDLRRKHHHTADDDSEESSKRRKHHRHRHRHRHHHHHHRRSGKKHVDDGGGGDEIREADDVSSPPPPLPLPPAHPDYDMEEGEILEEEGIGVGCDGIDDKKWGSDAESGEIKADGVGESSDRRTLSFRTEGSEAQVDIGRNFAFSMEKTHQENYRMPISGDEISGDDTSTDSIVDTDDKMKYQVGNLEVCCQKIFAKDVANNHVNGDSINKSYKEDRRLHMEYSSSENTKELVRTLSDDRNLEAVESRCRSRSHDLSRKRSWSRSSVEEAVRHDLAPFADNGKAVHDADVERMIQRRRVPKGCSRDLLVDEERDDSIGHSIRYSRHGDRNHSQENYDQYRKGREVEKDRKRDREYSKGGDRETEDEYRDRKERERVRRGLEVKDSRREKERDRSGDRDRRMDKERDWGSERDKNRGTERDRGRSRDRVRENERLWEQDRSTAKEREWERGRVREREREREWGRDRDREREREWGRDRDSGRGREGEKDKVSMHHNHENIDDYSWERDKYKTGSRHSRHYEIVKHRDRTSINSPEEAADFKSADKLKRDEKEQEDYQEKVSLKLAEQEEEDLNRIKEESRRRRQAILEKYNAKPLQKKLDTPEKDLEDNDPLEGPAHKSAMCSSVPESSNGRSDGADIYVTVPSFSVAKVSPQNEGSAVESPSGAGGLGEGTPKSERSDDTFCDDIFGESPAGIRKSQGKVDGLRIEKSNLHDNWDDAEGYYSYRFGEILDARYEITAAQGKGVFSTVVRAKDLRAGNGEPEEVAIKILRNNDTMYKAGMQELIILKKLVDVDTHDRRHCVRFISHFKYRNHLCLVFESLHMNLREVLKKFGRNIGLKLTAVQAYAKQLFIALKHLKNCGVLHCDIKPDNMLVNDSKNVLKLCDFGNAMFAGKNEITPYLVSRFYRAPEIILGLPYDHPLDIWSVGCCLYELFSGKVLFPGPSNNDMLRLHMELKGPFPKKMLRKGGFIDQHFDQDLNFHASEEDPVSKKTLKRLVVNIKPKDIGTIITGSPGEDPKMLSNFKDLLDKIFVLDPEKRMTVSQALNHPFITGK